MKLVASLIVRNELGRYLEPCIDHLLEFCDRVCVVNDGSEDDTNEWLRGLNDKRIFLYITLPRFLQHEGKARQLLIDRTVDLGEAWVLSLDADEFVSDGPALRRAIEANPNARAFSLNVTEIWNADQNHLWSREDGGWRTHPLTCLWRVELGVEYTMLDKALACRRVPQQVLALGNVPRSGVDLLHFGWTDRATRAARYQRYVHHDGGKFHASSHLKSIMWPENRMRLELRAWPEGAVFDGLRERFGKVAA